VRLHLVRGPAERTQAAANSTAELGALLDLLAEATLDGDGPADPDPAVLRTAVEGLRVRRLGDTLLYLTGPAGEADLGAVASLRGAYPSIIVGLFGPVEPGLATTAGMLVVGAADAADFAGAWDGVRAW
ncbi:MAG TPA: DUF58 domain-containing protein, partial [Micromonosporaceae bacterium]